MKKNWMRTLSLSLAALLLAGALSACGSTLKEDAQDEPLVDLGAMADEGVPLGDVPQLFTVMNPEATGKETKTNSSATIDYSNRADGYVMVKWTGGGTPKLKVQVKGPSGTTYTYNLDTSGKYETFPLSDGSGSYTVAVYKNVSGTSYSTVLSGKFDAKLADEFAPFLRPNQYVNFNEKCKAVAKGAELCADCSTNLEKVSAVYDFVVSTLSYDKEKAATVKSGYLPDVDKVLEAKKGICFDYAALMSAMLRSQGVPVKLVVGYTSTGEYHAWLNVWSEEDGWVDAAIYFDGKDWKLMDPTFASSSNKSASIMKYINNASNYTTKYLY